MNSFKKWWEELGEKEGSIGRIFAILFLFYIFAGFIGSGVWVYGAVMVIIYIIYKLTDWYNHRSD